MDKFLFPSLETTPSPNLNSLEGLSLGSVSWPIVNHTSSSSSILTHTHTHIKFLLEKDVAIFSLIDARKYR